ncbi:efflux RND transporter periplasmic adaptor subunit [Dechloromonas denitrificans]|uniref:efflux RND transporter periplasmic adaptor subunit n=1 Tax=Dechloromonas denitrificans TaxID=281362 RepID=UPI001CF8AABF|nr:efflux RND transporter periplasmic adaptor subunit [Dechloromonas denitrificans]UCV12648.1 efflux RND transporter periplasmic adaptor subunit [Dechloromonas denitrificans]
MNVANLPRRSTLSLIISAALGAAVLVGCSDNKAPAAPPRGPLPVTVLEVQPQRVPSSIEIMAQTEGARETEVRARVGGILVKRLYQEGETVKAGQPLFQIDRSTYEIALADAKAKAEQSAREMNRLKGLIEAKAISQKDYDDAVSANAIAQTALRQAELNLSWTTVTAPVSGTTGRAAKSEGNLISIGADSLLTSIYQMNPLWVRFSLGESDLAKFPNSRLTSKNVTGVELILPNGEVYPNPGKLNFLASNIDTTLGTQQLRAEFDNADNQLLPGQFVRIRLLTGERDGVFLVPQPAVIQTEQGPIVMLAGAEDKVAPRPVQLGEWRGKDWIVLGGLKAGDKVIVDNLMKLRPGAPVAPHGPGEKPGAPAPAAAPAKEAPAAAAPAKKD